MNEELWKKLDQLRSPAVHELEGIADFLQKEGIRFAASDLSTWSRFLADRTGRFGGTAYVPEWLAVIFSALLRDGPMEIICDPWAGLGFLIGFLSDACHPKKAIAFNRDQAECAVGKILVPGTEWQVGEPLTLLESVRELNAVASTLPLATSASGPLRVSALSGEPVELRDDLGNLILVSASMRLSSSGIGLFVVVPSFFFSSRSVFQRFDILGLSVEAAFALPSGTFAPYTNIDTYLVVVRRKPASRLFVAQFTGDANTDRQIVENLRDGKDGNSLELGRFVDPHSFTGLSEIRIAERISRAEHLSGAKAVRLGDLAKAINLGRFGEDFTFEPQENALFVPLIGNSAVVDSVDSLALKKHNYAQVVIDSSRSIAQFVANFLNSNLGKDLRQQSKTAAVIPKLNKRTLSALCVFVPDLRTQRAMVEIEAQIAAEQNTLLGLQNELGELQRKLWADPGTVDQVKQRLSNVSSRLGGAIKAHTVERLDQWFETLPFPLASILRAWQATPSHDFKTKYEHLLHFFEATAEFLGVIFLSAFSTNEAVFVTHKRKLAESLEKQHLSFRRATFGTWKLVVEYLGKQTRELLSENGKKSENAQNDRAVCASVFSDPSFTLPETLSRKELAAILTTTNKMRNDWSGHGGVVGQEEAQLRNEQLLTELQKLRTAFGDIWVNVQLIGALHCRPRRGVFENEVAILMGSNSEFLKETLLMANWLDVDALYLSQKESGRALKLLPLVKVGPSPESAKNACYFFNRLESGGARFVSYHFTDKPELTGQFDEAAETIKLLTQV